MARMGRSFLSVAALACAVLACPARADIYRCTDASGAVTYQQSACDAPDAKRLDIAESYPPVASGERERLLAREAALDRRLEARRERESREALARAALQAAVAPVPEAAAPEPGIGWVLTPAFPAHRHFLGHRGHGPRAGRSHRPFR